MMDEQGIDLWVQQKIVGVFLYCYVLLAETQYLGFPQLKKCISYFCISLSIHQLMQNHLLLVGIKLVQTMDISVLVPLEAGKRFYLQIQLYSSLGIYSKNSTSNSIDPCCFMVIAALLAILARHQKSLDVTHLSPLPKCMSSQRLSSLSTNPHFTNFYTYNKIVGTYFQFVLETAMNQKT